MTTDESHEEIGPVGNDVPSRLPELTVVHDGVADARNDLFGKHLSFASWCSQMVASVLRTRTAFSAFVRSAIHLSRDSSVSTSPAFLSLYLTVEFLIGCLQVCRFVRGQGFTSEELWSSQSWL